VDNRRRYEDQFSLVKAKIKQSHYRPGGLEGSRRLRLPDFKTIGT